MLYFETFEEVYSHIQSHEVEHVQKYITCSTSVGFGGGDGIDRCIDRSGYVAVKTVPVSRAQVSSVLSLPALASSDDVNV